MQGTSALDVTEQASADVAKRPKIFLDSIRAKMRGEQFFHLNNCPHMILCILTFKNEYAGIDQSAPVDSNNFGSEPEWKQSTRKSN